MGAAIWITGINSGKKRISDKANKSKISDLIDKFIKCTDCRFECSEIVGRKFVNIGDHAGYLRDGGCSEIIELLAAYK